MSSSINHHNHESADNGPQLPAMAANGIGSTTIQAHDSADDKEGTTRLEARLDYSPKDAAKDLGGLNSVMENFSTNFDGLSIIAQPISGVAAANDRQSHIHDPMISEERIRDFNADAPDYANLQQDDASVDYHLHAIRSQPTTTRNSGVVDSEWLTSQAHTASNSSTAATAAAAATTMTTTNNNNSSSSNNNGNVGGQWMMSMAAQTTQEMRQRMSMASDQLGLSLRQLYASATTMATGSPVDVPPSYHNIPGIVPFYRGRSSGPPPSYDDVINPYAPPPTYQSLFGQMREASKNSRSFMDLLKRLVILSTIGCSLLLAFVVLVPLSMIVVGAVYLNECRIEHIPGFLLVGGLVWASKNIIHCCSQCHDVADDDELPDYGYYEEQQHSTATQATEVSLAPSVDINTIGREFQETSANTDAAGATTNSIAVEQSSQDSPIRRTTSRRATKSSICESLLNCILFGWFVAGCVIVFRNNNPDFDDPNSLRFCNRTVYMYTFWLISSGLVVFTLFVTCICCLMISSAIATRQDDFS